MTESVDLIVAGAGAAGLMAAIQAARVQPQGRLLLLDGQARPGAKLLVSGGGRCNLTNRLVGGEDFQGEAPALRGAVLRALPVPATLDFFHSLGLVTVEESGGRIYPASQQARDVHRALWDEVRRLAIPCRLAFPVADVIRQADGFRLAGPAGCLHARRVVLALGGRSLPRSGSDGSGLELARGLGLRVNGPLVPGLAPLRLPEGHPLTQLAGISQPVELRWTGPAPNRCRGALLCTHFGVSGPAVLDASRQVLRALAEGREPRLRVDWLPEVPEETLRRRLSAPGGSPRLRARLQAELPGRLLDLQLERAGLGREQEVAQLPRERRERLLGLLKAEPLPVTGARSWHHAEVTAGGVSLTELDPGTLESRAVPGLHVCGELCDVDGRLGGFNFQWAWTSGWVAGQAAARLLDGRRPDAVH
ncbi:MAG: aminoacetone oxidase family FAD-binding enzyme [Candidatus Delongbacteria bacterium]